MLTRLRLKNWRSVQDVTIENLTPITVMIGGNSSGKTNIIDALKFIRDSRELGLLRAVNDLEYTRILRNAISSADQRVEIALSYRLPISEHEITDELVLKFDKRTVPFLYEGSLRVGDNVFRIKEIEFPSRDVIGQVTAYYLTDEIARREQLQREIETYISSFIRKRWQILSDQFMPKLRLQRGEGGDPYILEPDARNTLVVLEFMEQVAPSLFNEMQERAGVLLSHVSSVEIAKHSENDVELLVRESTGKKSWTVSTGTARIIAILTAIYALRMPQQDRSLSASNPSLIIIEEPDTSLSHWQYEAFVSMMREFAADWNMQFILTTHNPRFLDLFQPEEVRVVERDDEGITTVRALPEDTREIWLDEYGLGEVWTTNSFGDMKL